MQRILALQAMLVDARQVGIALGESTVSYNYCPGSAASYGQC